MGRQRAPGAGRPPTPTALKRLRGTDQPSRVNPNEPTPDAGIPTPPRSLDAMQRRLWRILGRQLLDMKVLTLVDGPALMNLVIAHSRVERANKKLSRFGAVTEDGKRSAWATELTQAQALLSRACAAFGLDPSSRTRVAADAAGASEPKVADDLGNRLFGIVR